MKPCGRSTEVDSEGGDAGVSNLSGRDFSRDTLGADPVEDCGLSKAMLAAVLDALPVGVIIADARGRIIRDNAASRELWGVPAESANWEGYADWVAYWPDTGERLKAGEWAMARTLRSGEEVRNELVENEHSQTGQRRFFLSNSAPIRDPQGRIVAAVVAELDVTERRRAVEALQEREEALRRLNADLERQVEERTAQARDALAKLFEAQKLECIGRFTSTVVHDFNNVLAIVIASLNGLRRLQREPSHTKAVDNAIEAAQRGAKLASRLLAFARRKEFEPRTVCVPVLLNGMRDLLEHSLGRDIICTLDAPACLPPVFADPNQLELALVNLATNARDAMPDGGTFLVDAKQERAPSESAPPALKDGRYIRIAASDTGCGMDETILARATEPLFTTKETCKGTGLGLAMIRDFVERSGGGLRIRSGRGCGTTVELWLPQQRETDACE